MLGQILNIISRVRNEIAYGNMLAKFNWYLVFNLFIVIHLCKEKVNLGFQELFSLSQIVTFFDITLFVNHIHDISFVYRKKYPMNLHFHSNFDKIFQMIEFPVIDIQKWK